MAGRGDRQNLDFRLGRLEYLVQVADRRCVEVIPALRLLAFFRRSLCVVARVRATALLAPMLLSALDRSRPAYAKSSRLRRTRFVAPPLLASTREQKQLALPVARNSAAVAYLDPFRFPSCYAFSISRYPQLGQLVAENWPTVAAARRSVGYGQPWTQASGSPRVLSR